MPRVDLLVWLLILTVPLVGLARRLEIPYPIVLVLGGLVLALVPGLPQISLPPELVLLIFLPPLLYWESVTAPSDVMWRNRVGIGGLAIGLVAVTTVVVALVAQSIFTTMSWPVALILGAIVSPTDELAFGSVAERLGVPRHLIAIIEGESLLNDATALVFYAAAVGAVVSGVFSPGQIALSLIWIVLGSLALGFAVGWLVVTGWRWIKDTQLQSVISVVAPFLAYLPADRLGLSGVLAVVTAGIFVNRWTPIVMTPRTRLVMTGFWETVVFLVNAVLFILVGLTLRSVVAGIQHDSWPKLIVATVIINVAILVLRVAWGFGSPFMRRAYTGKGAHTNWKHTVIASLAGMRGSVSLAAALAIPLMVSGVAFPHRAEIIFISFCVILVTLVGCGLALPVVVRALHVEPDSEDEDDERRAMAATAAAALECLDQLVRSGKIDAKLADHLRKHYEHHSSLYAGRGGGTEQKARMFAQAREEAQLQLIDVQRKTLIAMRERGELDNTVLRRLQLALDFEEIELERWDLAPESAALETPQEAGT